MKTADPAHRISRLRTLRTLTASLLLAGAVVAALVGSASAAPADLSGALGRVSGSASSSSAGASAPEPASASAVSPATLTLSRTSFSLEARDSRTLKAFADGVEVAGGDGAGGAGVVWESSDPAIVGVSQSGEVVGLAKGAATVTAMWRGGGGTASATCEVTVTNSRVDSDDVSLLQSPHDYEAGSTDVWTYHNPLASGVWLTFDARTSLEDGFDFLVLRDRDERLIGRYTGTELAGQRVYFEGDTAMIRLLSDDVNHDWGFAVTAAEPVVQDGWHEAYGLVYYYLGGAPQAGNVVIDGVTYWFDPDTGAFGWVVDDAASQPVAAGSTPATPAPAEPGYSGEPMDSYSFLMPNVYGWDFYVARDYLWSLGLGVDDEWYQDNYAPSGVVLGQSIPAGTLVSPDDGVILTVSAGMPQGTVPYVIGLDWETAASILASKGFSVATDFSAVPTDGSFTGYVYYTDPYEGTQAFYGDTVTIYVWASVNG